MLKKIASLLLLLMLVAAPASSTLVTIPYVFVPNTTIYSSQVNSDFSTLAGAINGNIDNSNIGVAGIYASQIIPTTTAQGTFGGTVGYTIAPSVATATPLTINAASGQTADILDVYNGTPAKAFWISGLGFPHVANFLTLNVPVGSPSYSSVTLGNDSGAVGGMVLNVPSGSTNGFSFDVNGTPVVGITNAGVVSTTAQVLATGNSATPTRVPPLYVNGGTAVAATAHSVVIATMTTAGTSNTGCPPHGSWTGYYCTSVTISPTFANTGISASTSTVGGSGNTLPTFSCGAPWGAEGTPHLFWTPLYSYGTPTLTFIIIDDTAPNTLYFLGGASQQVGPIICTGY